MFAENGLDGTVVLRPGCGPGLLKQIGSEIAPLSIGLPNISVHQIPALKNHPKGLGLGGGAELLVYLIILINIFIKTCKKTNGGGEENGWMGISEKESYGHGLRSY